MTQRPQHTTCCCCLQPTCVNYSTINNNNYNTSAENNAAGNGIYVMQAVDIRQPNHDVDREVIRCPTEHFWNQPLHRSRRHEFPATVVSSFAVDASHGNRSKSADRNGRRRRQEGDVDVGGTRRDGMTTDDKVMRSSSHAVRDLASSTVTESRRVLKFGDGSRSKAVTWLTEDARPAAVRGSAADVWADSYAERLSSRCDAVHGLLGDRGISGYGAVPAGAARYEISYFVASMIHGPLTCGLAYKLIR